MLLNLIVFKFVPGIFKCQMPGECLFLFFYFQLLIYIHKKTPPTGLINVEICRPLIFGDCRQWRKLSRHLWEFSEIAPERNMFFGQPIFNIQWENKGFPICQIVQNNDLPTWRGLFLWFHSICKNEILD